MSTPPHPDRPPEPDREAKTGDAYSKQSAEKDPTTTRPSRFATSLALVTVTAALVAAVGTYTTGRADEASSELVSEQNSMTQKIQRHDRFQDAGANLADSDIAVRINGVKTMKDLMRDYPSEQPDIVGQLSDFIRARASKPLSAGLYKPVTCPNEAIPDDVKAALKAIKERDPAHDSNIIINLSSTCLPNAEMKDGKFANTNFTSSFLDGSSVERAVLTGACFRDTRMHDLKAREATLFGTIFRGAFLYKANFTGAHHDNTTVIRDIKPDPSITGQWWQEADENVREQPLPSGTPTQQACLGP
ncbi:pentapeptide repeat-containing protein [Lentzea sp. NPDC059081]|uniref:pentapeptide repeat-containing protein n=1 Tax=Lentzea sp. NPDC059081 TaxID=3346719 RepID=UPI0036AD2D52